MKKVLSIIVALFLLTGTALAASYTSVNYPVLVNGTPMTFTDVQPINADGHTMLPLKVIGDAVGADVQWDGSQVKIQTIDTEALKKSCVLLRTRYQNGKQGTMASGVLIDYDTLLTCYHCVDEGANRFWGEYQDGSKANMTLTDTAPDEDSATLKPESMNVKPVKIGDSDEVKQGDTVYVISCPKGELNVVRQSKVQDINIPAFNVTGIQIDNVTEEGSSGGAVFNSKGELIGIVYAGTPFFTCVIPINELRKSLASK